MMAAPHAHFIHGLEGHGRGAKVLGLRDQGLAVTAPEMHMSLWGLRRRNSMARNLLRLPETRLALGLSTFGLSMFGLSMVGLSMRSRSGVALAAAPVGWLYWRRRTLVSKALARSYRRCLAIQREAIELSRPDVLVGSSWGGALAIDLMREGVWQGPTVLLAPAWARVRAWTGAGTTRWEPAHRVVVFHDPSDATVPFEDSERLARAAHVELRSVDAGGHRLLGLLESGELAHTVRDLAV